MGEKTHWRERVVDEPEDTTPTEEEAAAIYDRYLHSEGVIERMWADDSDMLHEWEEYQEMTAEQEEV